MRHGLSWLDPIRENAAMTWERYLLVTERAQHTLLFNPDNEAVFLMTNDIR